VGRVGISRECVFSLLFAIYGELKEGDRNEYLQVTYFDAIYLIDLCEPLLEIARQRFAARGWKNVHVLCQDASRFVLPEWESGALDPRDSLTAITLSYSLSMVGDTCLNQTQR